MSQQTPVAGPPVNGPVSPTPWGTYVKGGLWAIVAIIVLLFVFLNSEQVQVNFIFFQVEIALIFVLIGLLVIGFLLGFSFSAMRRRKATKALQQ